MCLCVGEYCTTVLNIVLNKNDFNDKRTSMTADPCMCKMFCENFPLFEGSSVFYISLKWFFLRLFQGNCIIMRHSPPCGLLSKWMIWNKLKQTSNRITEVWVWMEMQQYRTQMWCKVLLLQWNDFLVGYEVLWHVSHLSWTSSRHSCSCHSLSSLRHCMELLSNYLVEVSLYLSHLLLFKF